MNDDSGDGSRMCSQRKKSRELVEGGDKKKRKP
jgi:hypothetical protein